MITSALLQDLADCRDKAIAGGKAVNLGQLLRAGFPVPAGFVLTTEAYRQFRGTDLRQSAHPLAERIREGWRKLGGCPVAVRSSATAEDMGEASMAGQYETFLDIATEDALLDAVQCCWASLDSPRTRSYLGEHGMDLAQVAMAVIVQKLVPADVAGVMFTANPRTGSCQQMLIEASWGLGEAVVSGRVQPDVLTLDRATGRVLKAIIADKQIWVAPLTHEEKTVEDSRRRVPCLKSGDVDALWKVAQRAAEHFGNEQDLEWAIHDGTIHLLQSRPITTLAHAEAYEQLLQDTRDRLRQLLESGRGPWVLHNISETLKHPTPLTWSVIKRFMSGAGGFGAMYRSAGFDPSPRVCADGFLELIAGRVYMDSALAGEMFFESYPYRYDVNALKNNPDAAQAPPTIPAGTLRARVKAGRRVVAANQRVRELAATLDRNLNDEIIPRFVAWCAAEKQRDLAKLSPQELIDLWHKRSAAVMDTFAPQSLLPSLVCAMALADLRAFLDERFWDDDPDALATMLSAPETPDKTVLASAQLYEVAAGRRTVEQWLADFGHRAPDEFDLATPRWREQVDELRAMSARLKDGADPMHIHEHQAQESRKKLTELRARLDADDARELDEKVALAHRYMPFREDGKYYLMLGYDLLRDVALEAGQRLEIGSDVFYLTAESLFDALRVGFAPTHLIAQRKIAYDAEARVLLPQVIDLPAVEMLGEPAKVQSDGSHKAFPVSSGFARGTARIVRSPQEAGELGQGYILVCPSTDPAWTPLFVNAAGLVVESGGTLSHGAVVAREMNIPAVVLPGATALIADGESITVDGRNGFVSRGADEPAVEASPDDTRIRRELVPPVRGQRERRSARLRNAALLVWGVYLLAVFILPEAWLYRPTFALFDAVLWPIVRTFGRPATVAILAAAMAALTMLGQRILTDNGRLREAKRRASLLNKEALRWPANSARRNTMLSLANAVQMRIVAASLVPLAVLLGPMVMSFVWLPQRVDPAASNAPPGSLISAIATINSELRRPVTLEARAPLLLDDPEKAAQTLPPIREALERLYAQRQLPSDLSKLPWEAQQAAQREREEYLQDLRAFLDAGVPPQTLTWRLRAHNDATGRFPISVSTQGYAPLVIHAVLGEQYPPGEAEIFAPASSPIRSVKLVYTPTQKSKPVFWTPLAKAGSGLDIGWLLTYLVVYLPAMFGLRWSLRVA